MKIGQMLYGYCNGFFGYTSYSNKRVEAFGIDWIVARELDTGLPVFANFNDYKGFIDKFVEVWSKEIED